MKTVTLYLIRHGETYLNLYKKMQGWADAPLTPRGIADAEATGERLAHTKFDAVYTSDLGRTQSTAHIICSKNDAHDTLVPVACEEWRESSFGSFDGSFNDWTYAQVAEHLGIKPEELFQKVSFGEMLQAMKEVDPAHAVETNDELLGRLRRGIENILASSDDGAHVMVVTHGNVIRALVAAIDPSVNIRCELKNSGVTTVRISDGKAEVTGFNE